MEIKTPPLNNLYFAADGTSSNDCRMAFAFVSATIYMVDIGRKWERPVRRTDAEKDQLKVNDLCVCVCKKIHPHL